MTSSFAFAWAHPRSRGENFPGDCVHVGVTGSSPLTRGKPRSHSLRGLAAGLIPAHAGKTSLLRTVTHQVWAHPRSRGENSRAARLRPTSRGSSPLTRGKLVDECVDNGRDGLIPAHAGKTSISPAVAARPRAHPRSRGENRPLRKGAHPARGSSPLTRGKHRVRDHARTRQGLIPAHAGKTLRSRFARTSPTAHPRSRGENAAFAASIASYRGSSPLTRGKRRMGHESIQTTGLIPAHAGKTSIPFITRIGSGAHPRSRGENAGMRHPARPRSGSSPLTRGKQ